MKRVSFLFFFLGGDWDSYNAGSHKFQWSYKSSMVFRDVSARGICEHYFINKTI